MIVNFGLRKSLGALQYPSFLLPATTSIALTRGSGSPTFTRATVGTIDDWEGRHISVLSGEARFRGARRVYNHLRQTRSFSNAAWTKDTGGTGVAPVITDNYPSIAAPDGTFTATRLILDRSAGGTFSRVYQNPVSLSGLTGTVCPSVYMRTTDGTTQTVTLRNGNLFQPLVTVTGTWQRFAGTSTLTAGQGGIEILSFTTTGGTQAPDILVWNPQVENTTGQSNLNPGEALTVDVLSAPFHGANVDGVKYFDTLNGNTVASNVVTEATGAAISPSILVGLLREEAATQLVTPAASISNLTDAAWVKTTMTTAFTSVGPDGVANNATRCTATAGNATVLQTLVTAAATRTVSFLIKRVTGTGNIELTQDNGATWTNIASSLNSSTFTLVKQTQSQLNPVFGIRIVTNGDAIDVAMSQYEAGSYASSRILTVTTRNADTLTYSATNNVNQSAGTVYYEFTKNQANAASFVPISIDDGSSNEAIQVYGTSAEPTVPVLFVSDGGATQVNLATSGTVASNATGKHLSTYALNNFSTRVNSSTPTTDTSGTLPTTTTIRIGSDAAGTQALNGCIRNMAIFNRVLSNSQQISLINYGV